MDGITTSKSEIYGWKIKIPKTGKKRIELRKKFPYADILLKVMKEDVTYISMNGPAQISVGALTGMQQAIIWAERELHNL